MYTRVLLISPQMYLRAVSICSLLARNHCALRRRNSCAMLIGTLNTSSQVVHYGQSPKDSSEYMICFQCSRRGVSSILLLRHRLYQGQIRIGQTLSLKSVLAEIRSSLAQILLAQTRWLSLKLPLEPSLRTLCTQTLCRLAFSADQGGLDNASLHVPHGAPIHDRRTT